MPEALTLARFQDDFVAGLDARLPDLAPWLKPGASRAGLTVYRNTVAKGAIEAVVANFPSVTRLTGEAWLTAAAAEFVRSHPPASPALIAYGAEFPVWLAAFPPAQEIPCLSDVARLDRLWTECHLAADAEPLVPGALAGLSQHDLSGVAAVLHPSLRHAWFDTNVPALWRAQRKDGEPGPLSWEPQPEGVVFVRPHGAVVDLAAGPGLHAFVDACASGRPLTGATADALRAEPDLHLPALLAALLDAGAITGLTRVAP